MKSKKEKKSQKQKQAVNKSLQTRTLLYNHHDWRGLGLGCCFITWLAQCAGKTNQILRFDWLPKRARWSYLACKKKEFLPRITNNLLTKLVLSRWLSMYIGLVLFLRLGP